MLLLRGHRAPVRALAYSPDGGVLASGSDDHTIRLWDRGSGELLTTFTGHADAVRGLAFHPDGQILYSGSWDGTVRRWVPELARGSTVLTHLGTIWALALSPDGHDMVLSANHKSLLWRLADESPCFTYEGHEWPVTGVAFSHGCKYVVSSSQDRTLRVWDAHWGYLTQSSHVFPSWIHGVAVAPEMRTVASAGGDGIIRLALLPGLEPQGELVGHTGDVLSVAFLADRRLLSVSWDGTLRLWDVDARVERRALALGLGRLQRVAVAPDGMTAAVAGESNAVALIDLDMLDP